MKLLSEKKALEKLAGSNVDLKRSVAAYERRAKSCLTCNTPGACCLDEHFVNVHISRLEAISITRNLAELPAVTQNKVQTRIRAAIEKYGLSSTGDTYARTYACPLFEKGLGCLVHHSGK